jgi:hypothetical protein
MALVIWFTFIETKDLTLEQVEKRFNGVPRDEIMDVIEAYNGEKPLSSDEVAQGASVQDASEIPVKV